MEYWRVGKTIIALANAWTRLYLKPASVTIDIVIEFWLQQLLLRLAVKIMLRDRECTSCDVMLIAQFMSCIFARKACTRVLWKMSSNRHPKMMVVQAELCRCLCREFCIIWQSVQNIWWQWILAVHWCCCKFVILWNNRRDLFVSLFRTNGGNVMVGWTISYSKSYHNQSLRSWQYQLRPMLKLKMPLVCLFCIIILSSMPLIMSQDRYLTCKTFCSNNCETIAFGDLA